MIPPVRFRKREEISEIVDTIFAKHHPSREIPVPVDVIAEQMGLDLVPIPGFRARAGAEGALSTDRSTIYYDERGAELYAARYRFTVAHELGHCILHQPQLESALASSIDSWKRAVQSIDPRSYSQMEWQANEFAGQLLVPSDALHREYLSTAAEARAAGLALADLSEYAASTVAESIGKRFLVSGDVIYIRLQALGVFASRQ